MNQKLNRSINIHEGVLFMGRYEADLTKVSAGIPVFPKGDYEFTVGTPKAFKRKGKKGENWGVGLNVTCVEVLDGDPAYKGKKSYISLFMHSEGAQGFSKQTVMALYGYTTDPKSENNEQAFNEKFAGEDWSYDPESGKCGDIYKNLEGKRFQCPLDSRTNPDDDSQLQQVWGKIRPL